MKITKEILRKQFDITFKDITINHLNCVLCALDCFNNHLSEAAAKKDVEYLIDVICSMRNEAVREFTK